MNKNKSIKEILINLLQIGDIINIKNFLGIYTNDIWVTFYSNSWSVSEINESSIIIKGISDVLDRKYKHKEIEVRYEVPKNKLSVENNKLFINMHDVIKLKEVVSESDF